MRHSMRPTVILLLGLLALIHCGCSMLDPNSKFNVNRGEHHDEWDGAGVERRAMSDGLDHEDVDGLDKWLYSPTYRQINRNLGVD
jgi:hypothetical protein